jgi:type IV secretory pathway VirB6-like protein
VKIMLATIIGYLLSVTGVGLLALAVLVYFYVPLVGRTIALVLVIAAAGLFAYDAGYHMRGNLDKSAALRADIVELQRQADEARTVAANAAVAEKAAEDAAAVNQQKVDAYVAQLAKNPGCALSDDDVKRLLDIGKP